MTRRPFRCRGFRSKQDDLATQLATAQSRLNALTADYDRVQAHLEVILSLLTSAAELYTRCDPESRRMLNQAVFTRLLIDVKKPDTDAEGDSVATGELDQVVQAVVEDATTKTRAEVQPEGGAKGTGTRVQDTLGGDLRASRDPGRPRPVHRRPPAQNKPPPDLWA
ncbi:MAG: hypothetical protein WBG36_00010 [Ornithinimicrobium sp.]